MIIADEPVFPNNIIEIAKDRFSFLDSDLVVLRRPLRSSDPVQCMGLFANLWEPFEDSTEILGQQNRGPTIDRYTVTFQAMNKDMDEERALAVHSVFSERVRAIVYRDNAFRVGLQALQTNVEGVTKRLKRWKVQNQRYLSNEIQGEWLYLSTLELRVETENV